MSSETPNEGGHKKPPIPTPAKKIPALNIEKRGDRLYLGDTLHKWFAISSLLLFIITIAMVFVDYSREWKKYQRDFNRLQIQNLFRLDFIATCTNLVMIGNVGLGKTHLSIALGHAACTGGHSVLFTTAVDVINTLAAAQSAGQLKREIRRYLKPAVLIVDELGYLPIDKHGADLLFQIISERYERAPIVITTNRAYKHWAQIFNNDSTLTSAILDRVMHHVDTVVIEGKSFRMKDEVEE